MTQRKGIGDNEKGLGILATFEPEGHKPQEVIEGVKSIDNWFSQHTNNKTDWESLIHNRVMNKDQQRIRKETSLLRFDKKFVDICRSNGLT